MGMRRLEPCDPAWVGLRVWNCTYGPGMVEGVGRDRHGYCELTVRFDAPFAERAIRLSSSQFRRLEPADSPRPLEPDMGVPRVGQRVRFLAGHRLATVHAVERGPHFDVITLVFVGGERLRARCGHFRLQEATEAEYQAAAVSAPRHRPIVDETFEPRELSIETLAEKRRAEWISTVAARRSAHLRAVAQRLVLRGDSAAPLRCELLAPLFRGEGLTALQLPPELAGLDDYKTAAAARPGKFRWKRVAQRATRAMLTLPDGNVWTTAKYENEAPASFYAFRSWAASCADWRFRLTSRSAPALVAYAELIERAHALHPQPALWLGRPTGWLHGEVMNLVVLLHSRPCRDLISHAWEVRALTLDLLAPLEEQLHGAPVPAVEAARRLAQRVVQIGRRRGPNWSEARLVLTDKSQDCNPDDTWCRVTLETLAPFHRVDAWVNDAFDLAWHTWLPIKYWPDATDVIRGPGERGWFEPDGRHWRSRVRKRVW